MKKRFRLLFFLFILLAACTAPEGTAVTDPVIPTLTTDTGWWIDTTGKMSATTEQQLEALSSQISQAGFQLGGVIFSNSASDGMDIATKLGNQTGLGSAEKDNGIAIVVFLDKAGGSGEKPAISVAIGSGLEGSLNDAKVGRFLDQTFVPARSDGQWEKGLVDFVSLLQRYLADPNADEFRDPPQDLSGLWVILIFVGIIMLLVLLLAAAGISGSGGSGGSSGRRFSSSSSSSSHSSSRGGGGGFSGGGASR